MGNFKDKTGMRFGKLTVIEYAGSNAKQHSLWLCKCECGKTTIVRGGNLTSGNTTSCGCKDHHLAKTRIYDIWHGMKSRCYRKNHVHYKNYGGRGISVCDEWKNDFMSFYDWAIKNGYDDSLTIDRINNDGNYCPENCRWVTQQEQMNNTRFNRNITFNGETHTLTEWSRICGISISSLYYRIRSGWELEKVFGTPSTERLFVTINGETKTPAEWERVYGVSRKTVWERVKNGWNPVDAVTIPPGGKHRKVGVADGKS